MREMIESVCAAEPSRGRGLEETTELDVAELALDGHLERIARQRSGTTPQDVRRVQEERLLREAELLLAGQVNRLWLQMSGLEISLAGLEPDVPQVLEGPPPRPFRSQG